MRPDRLPADIANWKGAWALYINYIANDAVENDGTSYICILAHTSASGNEPGTGGSWETYWDLMAQAGATGPSGGPSGPTGATGAASTVSGPSGPTGAASTVSGPTGPASTVSGPSGPTGAASTVSGPTGPASTVSGPSGPTGAASTVSGPTGAASTVSGPSGPTGAASTVSGPSGPSGPSGAASTVSGPSGPSGPTGPSSRYIEYRILDKDTSHTVDTGVGGELRVPEAMTVADVGAYVDTAGVTGTATFDINEAGTTIMAVTKITIDTGEKTSETAAAPPVISDSAIGADNILTFDIDVIQTTPAKGLVVWLKVVF